MCSNMTENQYEDANAESSAQASGPTQSAVCGEEGTLTRRVIGDDCTISNAAFVGCQYDGWEEPTRLGDRATVRSGSTIYADVTAGDNLQTGHNVLIRERTTLGSNVLVGTNTTIDGETEIGSNVSLQTGVYIPSNSKLGDRVFVGPGAVFTNDPYPIRQEVELQGPTLENDVSVGANATVLPGVTVGERSFIAAGAVVTQDVPPDSLVVGVPGEIQPLPDEFEGGNQL